MGRTISRSYSTTIYGTDEYEITEVWDVIKGSSVYTLFEKYQVCSDGLVPSYYWHKIHSDDKEWAERTAEHYGIEIKHLPKK